MTDPRIMHRARELAAHGLIFSSADLLLAAALEAEKFIADLERKESRHGATGILDTLRNAINLAMGQ